MNYFGRVCSELKLRGKGVLRQEQPEHLRKAATDIWVTGWRECLLPAGGMGGSGE